MEAQALPARPSRGLCDRYQGARVALVTNVLGAGQRKHIFLTKQQDELFLGLYKLSVFQHYRSYPTRGTRMT